MIGRREYELRPPADRIDVPRFAVLFIAVLTMAFLLGALDALQSSHFTSWHRLTARPTEPLPRAIEGALTWVRALTMIGGVAFGITSVERSVVEGAPRAVRRAAAVTFAPILVEVSDVGTQDGSVPDLDVLPPHSLVGLALVVLGPILMSLNDWRLLRTVLR